MHGSGAYGIAGARFWVKVMRESQLKFGILTEYLVGRNDGISTDAFFDVTSRGVMRVNLQEGRIVAGCSDERNAVLREQVLVSVNKTFNYI